MSEGLQEQIAYKFMQEFFQQKPFVLFGTGTSCAVDLDFGMSALKEHLLREIPNTHLGVDQKGEWELVVKNLENGIDLEAAMNPVQDDDLIERIVRSTAKLVSSLDRKYSSMLLLGRTQWPAATMFKRLVDRLSELDPVLHVATPNYDLLAEYSFERNEIPYTTGFCGGVCRQRDWKTAELSMLIFAPTFIRRKAVPSWKTKKHIRLYKVHGSLNTFKLNNAVVENNAWMHLAPEGVERVMITPGTSKYKKLHQNRPDLLGEYDQAIEHHNTFLFIGFGFNDSQLCNDAIMRKLKEQKCKGLIITRSSTARIEDYLKDCENLWLVSSYTDTGVEGTCISNYRYGSTIVKDKRLWDAGEFTHHILGG